MAAGRSVRMSRTPNAAGGCVERLAAGRQDNVRLAVDGDLTPAALVDPVGVVENSDQAGGNLVRGEIGVLGLSSSVVADTPLLRLFRGIV